MNVSSYQLQTEIQIPAKNEKKKWTNWIGCLQTFLKLSSRSVAVTHL